MTDQYQGVCNCKRLEKPAGTPHESWCAFLRPPKPSDRHRPCTADVLRGLTGGAPRVDEPRVGDDDHEMLYGIPEAIGTSEDFPLTHRPGVYLAQPRPPAVIGEAATSTIKRLVCVDLLARGEPRGPESVVLGEADAVRLAYGSLLDAAMSLRRWLQTRDGQ